MQDIIKAISLHQPWAHLIKIGVKKFETRSWGTNYRGNVLICSAKKKTRNQREIYQDLAHELTIDIEEYPWDLLDFGKGIVLVNLIDCIQMTSHFIDQQSEKEKLCGHWEVGRLAWQLETIEVLPNPIDIIGRQGLWNISWGDLEKDQKFQTSQTFKARKKERR